MMDVMAQAYGGCGSDRIVASGNEAPVRLQVRTQVRTQVRMQVCMQVCIIQINPPLQIVGLIAPCDGRLAAAVPI